MNGLFHLGFSGKVPLVQNLVILGIPACPCICRACLASRLLSEPLPLETVRLRSCARPHPTVGFLLPCSVSSSLFCVLCLQCHSASPQLLYFCVVIINSLVPRDVSCQLCGKDCVCLLRCHSPSTAHQCVPCGRCSTRVCWVNESVNSTKVITIITKN